MRVAFLSSTWYPETGGGIVHVEELARRLESNYGCSVDIITMTTDSSTDTICGSDRIVQISGSDTEYRFLNELRYLAGVLSELWSTEYDIVHAHTNTATIPLQIIRVLKNVPVVFTVHGANLNFNVTYTGSRIDSLYSLVRKIILKKFQYDSVISVSKELADTLSKYHNTVSYIPNGVDVDEFPKPTSYGTNEILFVGRLRPKKNPTMIVKTMKHVTGRYPEAQLHVVGEGPLLPEIRSLVVELGISDNVNVHGYVTDEELNELYDRCSVLSLVSDWEGHPLVLLEAWASGMVVVGSDVEGIREYVAPVPFGELITPGEVKELAEKINSLLDDQTDLETMGQDAYQHVEREFSWDTMAERTFELYQELHANRS